VAGIDCPYQLVRLRVRDRYGVWATIPFRIDTGADTAVIPVAIAKQQGIAFQETVPSTAMGLVGTTKTYRDRITVQIAGREHDWPCEFIDVPPEVGNVKELPPVLGRAGFLDEYAVAIDAGYVILTRLGPIRRTLRRWREGLWATTGQILSPHNPL
jgi:hypothetical protein